MDCALVGLLPDAVELSRDSNGKDDAGDNLSQCKMQTICVNVLCFAEKNNLASVVKRTEDLLPRQGALCIMFLERRGGERWEVEDLLRCGL